MEVDEDVNSTIETEMDSATHVTKKEAPKLIGKYFQQLTQGCGNSECTNQYCASSPTFYHHSALTPNEAAAQALKLLQQKVSALCDSKSVGPHQSESIISKSDHVTNTFVDQDKPGPSRASLPSASQQTVKPVVGLNEELVQETIEQCRTNMQWSAMIKLIGSSYSDLDVLMKSFRSDKQPDSESASGTCHVLDLAALQRVYKIMFSLPEDTIYTALANAIINAATTLSIELQYRSVYERNANILDVIKIILEIPCLHSPEFLDRAYPEFLTAMNHLPLAGQEKLVLYLAGRGAEYLRNLVQSLQQLITVRIVSQQRLWNSNHIINNDNYITAAARVMKLVYYASLKAGEVDPPEILEKEKQYCDILKRNIQEYLQSASESSIKERTGIKRDSLAEALSVRHMDCRVPAVPDSEFINDLVNETLEMDQDFTYYKAGGSKFTFILHPFLLTTTNKSMAMYYDNRIRMISERRSALMSSMLHGAPSMPYLRLRVRRDHIIDDALVGLEMTFIDNPDDLKKQLYVEFEGEQGIDEGGVSKEFFQLIVEEIFNPDFGMFVYSEETRQFWFNGDSYENGAQFTLVGILLGLAIYNHVILDVHLPLVIYRKLLGKLGTLQDMELSHPVQYLSLKQLLDYEGNVEEDIASTFTLSRTNVFGEMVTHSLKDKGSEIAVTNNNRQEFANLYADYLLNKQIDEQFSAFNRGFHMVVDESPLEHLVNAAELELLVCGSQDWDVTALEATTEYDGGYERDDETVRYFWEAVHAMTVDELRKLLQFTTGSDRVPVGGLAKLKLVIARNGPDCDRLPTSHTCFNVLLLPDYRNKEKVKRLLLLAITHAKGFGML